MTQTDQVIRVLRLRGPEGLTPGQALDWIGTMRLAARISEAKDLLEPGEEIVNIGQKLPNGKHVARYVLVYREPAQLRLAL